MSANIRTVAALGTMVFCLTLPGRAQADCGGGRAWSTLSPAAGAGSDAGRRPMVAAVASFDNDSDHRALIVGLWNVTLVADGSVIDVGFDAWHADGTETLNDASPVSHNVCLGVWVQTAPRTFQLKHPAFRYDADGNVIGTLILRETNVVNRAGDRFTGTFTIEFFDLAGASVFKGAGDIYGRRVTVD